VSTLFLLSTDRSGTCFERRRSVFSVTFVHLFVFNYPPFWFFRFDFAFYPWYNLRPLFVTFSM